MREAERSVRPRTTTALAVAVAGITLGLVAVAWFLAFQNRDINVFTSQFGPDLVIQLGLVPVGVVVATRQRGNPMGWLFLAGALVGSIHAVSGEYAIRGLLAASNVPGTAWAAWVSNWVINLVFPCGILLLIVVLFPNGQLVSPRWRWLIAAAALFTALLLLITLPTDYPILVAPNLRPVSSPIAISGISSTFLGSLWVIWPLGVILLLVGGASVVVRYRRSAGEERQQIKWFAYAVGITLVTYAASVPLSLGPYNTPIANAVLIAGFAVAMPLACGVAILKYRLYDIDVVISRTLVYGSLAVLITGVYVGIAVGIGALVGSGGRPNLGLSILATAIVAVGFQPVRERVQRVANRLVYGKRATPYEVLAQFSERVAESYAVDEVMPRMARVLAEGTGAQRADVWVRSGGTWQEAAVWPEGAPAERAVVTSNGTLPPVNGSSRMVEVRHQGDLLGALAVTKRAGEQLTPVEESLLADLAGQAGLVLRNVGLTSDLQARIEELRASRQRLVTAQDEERRRLERNLHDGAQQHLVALKVKLGLAEMLAGRDPEKAKATLAQLKGDADEALETLRDLARGIYPPLLADKGLVVALESQARKATLPVTVEAENVARYPQDIEAAVYFCVLEALQNVQKYAHASHAVISLRADGEQLQFSVTDDGVGFDPATAKKGAGLTNMVDRMDALGGRVQVESAPRKGTALSGALPLYAATLVAAVVR